MITKKQVKEIVSKNTAKREDMQKGQYWTDWYYQNKEVITLPEAFEYAMRYSYLRGQNDRL